MNVTIPYEAPVIHSKGSLSTHTKGGSALTTNEAAPGYYKTGGGTISEPNSTE
jgi:hypothetical protein